MNTAKKMKLNRFNFESIQSVNRFSSESIHSFIKPIYPLNRFSTSLEPILQWIDSIIPWIDSILFLIESILVHIESIHRGRMLFFDFIYCLCLSKFSISYWLLLDDANAQHLDWSTTWLMYACIEDYCGTFYYENKT